MTPSDRALIKDLIVKRDGLLKQVNAINSLISSMQTEETTPTLLRTEPHTTKPIAFRRRRVDKEVQYSIVLRTLGSERLYKRQAFRQARDNGWSQSENHFYKVLGYMESEGLIETSSDGYNTYCWASVKESANG